MSMVNTLLDSSRMRRGGHQREVLLHVDGAAAVGVVVAEDAPELLEPARLQAEELDGLVEQVAGRHLVINAMQMGAIEMWERSWQREYEYGISDRCR